MANRRTLHFNFSSLEPTVQCTAVHLVFHQPNELHNCTINLYESNSEEPLDSHTTMEFTEWLVFSIYKPGNESWKPTSKENYTLTLELVLPGQEPALGDEIKDFFGTVTPRLVIYSYSHILPSINVDSSDIFPGKPDDILEDDGLKKRSTDDVFSMQYSGDCSVRSVYLTWEKMGFLGPNIEVILPSPEGIDYTFCYGYCKSPLGNINEYTRHAQIIQTLIELKAADLPPTSCVPKLVQRRTLIYSDELHRMTKMENFPKVLKCSCQ